MVNRIQQRRDTAANWATANPVLRQGEEGYVLDTGDRKLGDGSTPWIALNPWTPNTIQGTSKLVNIGDQAYASTFSSYAASTVGTSEYSFKVGVASTNIAALFNHWYTTQSGVFPDTDPSGPITFSASIRVVSTTSPGTVVGTVYRLTFGGRITVTLDPGGRIVSDPAGISVAVGDVVAVRTYLSSGTAYAPRVTYNWVTNSQPNGFTAATDLTGVGSAAPTASQGIYYGPAAILGHTDAGVNAKSVLAVGDSAIYSLGDSTQYYRPELNIGGWQIRALSGIGGLLNIGAPSDAATYFQATGGSLRRYSSALRANSAIIEYGAADLNNISVTAANLEPINVNIASNLRRMGIARVFLTTIVPRATSTDGWITTTNQTVATAEPQRVLYNTWVRARCPISATTKLPVAVGTGGALVAGQFGHPITGIIDICAPVETAMNSGLWLPAQRTTTGSMSSGVQTLTAAGASFNSAAIESGGDKGTAVSVPGAGVSGGLFTGYVFTVGSGTSATITGAPSTTVSNVTVGIGVATTDGLHPSPRGHMLIAAAINTAVL
jgi:lysophospholipase L1-like esterase